MGLPSFHPKSSETHSQAWLSEVWGEAWGFASFHQQAGWFCLGDPQSGGMVVPQMI